jgi:hypothetical protein
MKIQSIEDFRTLLEKDCYGDARKIRGALEMHYNAIIKSPLHMSRSEREQYAQVFIDYGWYYHADKILEKSQ